MTKDFSEIMMTEVATLVILLVNLVVGLYPLNVFHVLMDLSYQKDSV